MTAQLSTLWTRNIQIDERLREIYFGEEEGEIYDQLPEEEKARINSIDYQAKQGESYRQVNGRVKKFIKTELFKDKQEGFYMLYTHGGLICCLTWEYGLKDVLGNCSVVGFQIDDKNDIKNIDLVWKFPEHLVID